LLNVTYLKTTTTFDQFGRNQHMTSQDASFFKRRNWNVFYLNCNSTSPSDYMYAFSNFFAHVVMFFC